MPRGRPTGNYEYWDAVERCMVEHDLSRRDAEARLMFEYVKPLRKGPERRQFDAIAPLVKERWGLGRRAYYSRLKWVHERYLLL